MNLAAPAALAWLGLAVPIVIFYILKIRLRRVPVSTILFWRQIYEEKQPRSIWQHLRHLISLLLQLLLLSLLVFALTDPFFHWEVRAARKLVLVIDNSASMNATDVAPTRLAKAKLAAQRAVDGMRFRDEMAIVVAGTQPQVACGFTGHQKTLRRAIDAVPATDGPTRVAAAFTLARQLLGDPEEQKRCEVIVLTDGRFEDAGSDALRTALTEPDVRLIVVGERTGNVGITQFQVRRSLLDPIGYEILVEVTNASDEAVECRLEMNLNDEVVDVVPLKLAVGGRWSQSFEKTSRDGGRLVANLDHADALAADNTAWALLPQREPQPVTLVTDGNLFLQKALEANPLVQLTTVKELPPTIAKGTVLVLHRHVPNPLPAGAVFVLDPTGASDLWRVGDKLQNPIVTQQDKDSPLMAHTRLDNVLMPEARKLTLAEDVTVQRLASAVTGDPLYFAIERPSGKVLVLTVNLDEGDLPLRTAFPIMVTNALAWFAGHRGDLRESLATGCVSELNFDELKQSMEGPTAPSPGNPGEGWGAGLRRVSQTPHPNPLPGVPGRGGSSESRLELVAPDGSRRPLPVHSSKVTIGPFDRCGVWSVVDENDVKNGKKNDSADDAMKQMTLLELACNLANRDETDIRPPQAMLDRRDDEPSLAGFGLRPIWFYLIAAAWLLATVEWFLYQRRWIT